MGKILEKMKLDWKRYSIGAIIALSSLITGLLIGMTLTEIDTIKQILINTISGIVLNAPWFILIFIGINVLSKSIKDSGRNLVKNIPSWISEYEKIKRHERTIERAMGLKSA